MCIVFDKKIIQNNFDCASESYDEFIYRAIARDLIDFCGTNLSSVSTEQACLDVMEIGCGTGALTKSILHNNCFTVASLTCNDLSQMMLAKVSEIHSCITTIHGDIECIDFVSNKYDLSISSMVFQWFNDFYGTIHKILNNTQYLCFCMPIVGTFDELYSLYECNNIQYKNFLHDWQDITNIMNNAYRCTFWRNKYHLYNVRTVHDLYKYLKIIGANYNANQLSYDAIRNVLLISQKAISVYYDVLFCFAYRCSSI